MNLQTWGQVCSLLAALNWAIALIFFKRIGHRMTPMQLNLFKNVVGLVMLGLTAGVLAWVRPAPASWSVSEGVPLETTPGKVALLAASGPITGMDLLILALSGIIGIAFADTIFFHGLKRIEIGLVAIVDCAYSPCVIFFSWLLLGEVLTLRTGIGTLLILGGVALAGEFAGDGSHSARERFIGIAWVIVSLALMALGIVMAKPVLAKMSDIPATLIRLAAGTAVMLAFMLMTKERKALPGLFRPSPLWRISVPGSIFAAYLSLMFWIMGFKYTSASVAAVLNQTTTIFAALLAWIFLKERFTPLKLAATALAVAGTVIVVWKS